MSPENSITYTVSVWDKGEEWTGGCEFKGNADVHANTDTSLTPTSHSTQSHTCPGHKSSSGSPVCNL